MSRFQAGDRVWRALLDFSLARGLVPSRCVIPLRSRRFGFWESDAVTQMVRRLLMSEQAQTSLVLPLRNASTHLARWDAGSTKTVVGGSDDGNAHSSVESN